MAGKVQAQRGWERFRREERRVMREEMEVVG